MAKQPRKVPSKPAKKPARSRKRRSDELPPPPSVPSGAAEVEHYRAAVGGAPVRVGAPVHRFVAFGDLHVDSQTLERACRVLRRVSELSVEHDAVPICLGDFWNLRGMLNVRQVDAVLTELERLGRWILIPGNHDQVTLDGLIHGLNVFRGMPNVSVITEPSYDVHSRIALLPWREHLPAQRALFEHPEGLESGWTVFAHAEIDGAELNSGKRSGGHVPIGLVEAMARACYLGHLHKRQRLGDRTWYIGSPFQQNVGERNDPHGVALIRTDQLEPQFIELEDFPKYWRISLADVEAGNVPEIDARDVVELVAEADELAGARYRRAAASLPTESVRPHPSGAPEVPGSAPSFALTLEHALEQYVAEAEIGEGDVPREVLLEHGRAILASLPEARRLPALGRRVAVISVVIVDFCALRGKLDIRFPEGRVLLMGEAAQGKTAVIDSLMWCFYGETTPRKAGQSGATLRADAVINDAAEKCVVSAMLDVDGRTVVITRQKQRGSGARAEIRGIVPPDGISDQQALIDSIIGLPHALWRACVSLGQGSVGNFATDADKKRKQLLSSAFGLDVCPSAQKAAKRVHAAAEEKLEDVMRKITDSRARLETLEQVDVAAQSAAWVAQRDGELAALTARGTELNTAIADCDRVLADEARWQHSRGVHDQNISALTKRLGASQPTAKIGQLQQQLGAARTERGVTERDLNNARKKLEMLIATAAANCETCGQPLPETQREQHVHSAEVSVRSLTEQLKTFDHRISNIVVELDAVNTTGSQDQQQIEASISESRAAIAKCDEALRQFTRVRANRESAERERERARADYKAKAAQANPFEEQARRAAEQIASLRGLVTALQDETLRFGAELQVLEFWGEAFGQKGIPVIVLRTALYDLETAANRYLAWLTDGRVHCKLFMDEEDLRLSLYEIGPDGEKRPREYEALSGGQRRCVELAFTPFALSDLVFARTGVHIGFLGIDELTTHLDAFQKQRACELLEQVDRHTVLVVDHDVTVQGHFGTKWLLSSSKISQI